MTAATGRPIDDLLVVPVICFAPDFPFLDRSHAVRQTGGQFRIELERTDIEHGIQIEAPEATWNPTTGCAKISPGCTHCYAERMAIWLKAMGQRRYSDAFDLTSGEPASASLRLAFGR